MSEEYIARVVPQIVATLRALAADHPAWQAEATFAEKAASALRSNATPAQLRELLTEAEAMTEANGSAFLELLTVLRSRAEKP